MTLFMPFGKHRGESVEDLPTDYIEWLLGNTDVDVRQPHLATELQAQLDMRAGRGVSRGPGPRGSSPSA